MVEALGSPQPVFTFPPVEVIPDDADDKPEPGISLGQLGPLDLPELVFGAAALSHHYNSEDYLASDVPFRTVRLALRYGIRAFDTSPYYGASEIVLGTVLKALRPEFPRTSYKLLTKCGRYGPASFDYSPATIRTSVTRSLIRLNTDHLDAVYLHDVEFVCASVTPKSTGNHATALKEDKAAYGLLEGEEGKLWGEGDQKILDAVAELRTMQEEGLIKAIGISGFPLPTLLRLALLVLHTPPYKPLDIIMSYSHLCLQNTTFIQFLPEFRKRAQISDILTASPLSMGLLTPSPPPWHPALEVTRAGIKEATVKCAGWEGGLVNIALGYAMRHAKGLPTVVGLSKPREVHENIKVWREVQQDNVHGKRNELEEECVDILDGTGYLDWSWATA